MQTVLAEMQAITNFETGDEEHDTNQLKQLEALEKGARPAVQSASPADQLAFLEGYCALNERIGHQDSFGIMAHLEHTADLVWIALKATHGPQIQAIVEASFRRRVNGGTLKTLRSYGKASRAIELLTELRDQGATFVGYGGEPKNSDYAYYLKVMGEDLASGFDED